jgi:ATP-binding cassette subfamily B protein
VQHWQDAKLSLERLSEIHNRPDEEPNSKELISDIEISKDILISGVDFKYDGVGNINVLSNLCLSIPAKKITAIVGASGSGKTTLMKLLLKFYDPVDGNMLIGTQNFKNLSP